MQELANELEVSLDNLSKCIGRISNDRSRCSIGPSPSSSGYDVRRTMRRTERVVNTIQSFWWEQVQNRQAIQSVDEVILQEKAANLVWICTQLSDELQPAFALMDETTRHDVLTLCENAMSSAASILSLEEITLELKQIEALVEAATIRLPQTGVVKEGHDLKFTLVIILLEHHLSRYQDSSTMLRGLNMNETLHLLQVFLPKCLNDLKVRWTPPLLSSSSSSSSKERVDYEDERRFATKSFVVHILQHLSSLMRDESLVTTNGDVFRALQNAFLDGKPQEQLDQPTVLQLKPTVQEFLSLLRELTSEAVEYALDVLDTVCVNPTETGIQQVHISVAEATRVATVLKDGFLMSVPLKSMFITFANFCQSNQDQHPIDAELLIHLSTLVLRDSAATSTNTTDAALQQAATATLFLLLPSGLPDNDDDIDFLLSYVSLKTLQTAVMATMVLPTALCSNKEQEKSKTLARLIRAMPSMANTTSPWHTLVSREVRGATGSDNTCDPVLQEFAASCPLAGGMPEKQSKNTAVSESVMRGATESLLNR